MIIYDYMTEWMTVNLLLLVLVPECHLLGVAEREKCDIVIFEEEVALKWNVAAVAFFLVEACQ